MLRAQLPTFHSPFHNFVTHISEAATTIVLSSMGIAVKMLHFFIMSSHVIFAIRGSDGQTTQHYNRTINMKAKDAVGFAGGQINVEVGLRRCCKLVDAHAARKLNHFWPLKSHCPSILAV